MLRIIEAGQVQLAIAIPVTEVTSERHTGRAQAGFKGKTKISVRLHPKKAIVLPRSASAEPLH